MLDFRPSFDAPLEFPFESTAHPIPGLESNHWLVIAFCMLVEYASAELSDPMLDVYLFRYNCIDPNFDIEIICFA